ncbi:MAG: energy transducer TonB, partial [Myxococcota bacterium]|nr:energy transducer TonB [Myxococcota bacterium]
LSGLQFGLEGLDMNAFADGEEGLLQTGEELVMTMETVDQPPKAIQRTAPVYPSRAHRKGIEGYVVLSLLIDVQGRVQDVVIVESHPLEIFDEAASSSIASWKFHPAMYEGGTVAVRVTQTLRFQLGS